MANDLTPGRTKQALHDSFAADLADLKAFIAAEPEGRIKALDEKDEAVAHKRLERIASRHAARGVIALSPVPKEP